MDIMMPKMDGVSATMKLRENSNAPVIFLTAKSEDNDKIFGLTAGADDYITKPFNPMEVIARVKAQLRRYAYFGGMEKKEDTISVGGIELDESGKSVTLNGEPVSLTPTEYDILNFLSKTRERFFPRRKFIPPSGAATLWVRKAPLRCISATFVKKLR